MVRKEAKRILSNKRKVFRKLVVGVTGGFGTGKTTVAGMFKSFGAAVIDADEIARLCLRPSKSTYAKVVRLFGNEIINEDASINRKRLAEMVFSHPRLRHKLNALVHPAIKKDIKAQVQGAHGCVVVIDAPLLFETGIDKAADKVVVVTAGLEQQVRRLKKRAGLERNEVMQRIQSQMPLEKKARMADFIIDNSGSIRETAQQAKRIWFNLNAPPGRKKKL
jgi:dephospho-CoA kinase